MAIILAVGLIFVALIYLFGGGFGAKYETVNHDITDTAGSGICRITTTTGNINISLEK